MQDSKTRKTEKPLIDANATSKETLKDLEESSKVADSTSDSQTNTKDVPSPDGAVDERDETEDSGPI